MMSCFFFLIIICTFYCTGCLGMNDDNNINGTELLQERIEHLVNYTAYEALEHLNLKRIGNKVADIAYKKYKDKLRYEYPRHCNDFSRIRKPPANNGLAIIKPDDGEAFPVYCNMHAFGGGWTRILHRYSQRMNFNLDWNAYKNGFGQLHYEGWLGLAKIHRLTKTKPATLLISIRDKDHNWYYPQYRSFQVGSEATKYQLYIGNFTGDGGDSLSYSHNAKFSTHDQDNDISPGNCADSYRGGWWYYNCAQGKLTGEPYADSTSNSYIKWPSISSRSMRHAYMDIKLHD